jgi:hypothetical protein
MDWARILAYVTGVNLAVNQVNQVNQVNLSFLDFG